MIDINLAHAARMTAGLHEDWLEYKGWDKEVYSLDFSNRDQALYAINKWLLSEGHQNNKVHELYEYQIKEACRYCLTKVLAWGSVYLPGIDTDINSKEFSIELWKLEMQKFYLLLWGELFPDDPYKPADLSQYRQRVDFNFVHFPHMPETWGEPEYKPW